MFTFQDNHGGKKCGFINPGYGKIQHAYYIIVFLGRGYFSSF
jgi:hypothetical protein